MNIMYNHENAKQGELFNSNNLSTEQSLNFCLKQL